MCGPLEMRAIGVINGGSRRGRGEKRGTVLNTTSGSAIKSGVNGTSILGTPSRSGSFGAPRLSNGAAGNAPSRRMGKGVLAAAILVACAASAWSQEPRSATPALLQPFAELQPDAATVEGEPLPEVESAAPWLVDDSSSGNNGNRMWGSAEMLLWWIKSGQTPPLATSGTLDSLGALGPGTTTLLGGDQNYNMRLGGRFTVGSWLDPGRTQGIEGSFLFLSGPASNFSANSADLPGSLVLARPFFNSITGLQDSQLTSFPGISSGTVASSSGSQLLGGQMNMLCNLFCCQTGCCQTACCPTDCCQADCCESGYRLDLISGFSYLRLRENLVITENVNVLPTAPSPPFVPGQSITLVDRFDTTNNFYGAQIGLRAEWWRGAWFMNVTGLVALGDTHQQVRISGTTVFTNPGGVSVTQQGGLLALPTNIGTQNQDAFTVVPQIGLNVGRQVTAHMRVFVGYTLLYWSNVVRPGDQIDFVVNPTQLPTSAGPGTLVGDARPAPLFNHSDFWALGINFGVGFVW